MKKKQQNKTLNANQRVRKQIKKSSKNSVRRCTWLESVYMPFSCLPTHIPDERTTISGLVTSRQIINTGTQFNAQTGATTNHNFGILCLPHIAVSPQALVETASGNQTFTDLASSGTLRAASFAWPNRDSLVGGNTGVGRYRTTAMAIRITYLGTEVQRAGRYFAGLLPITAIASTVGGTGTRLSPVSVAGSGITPSLSNLVQQMEYLSSARVADGTFEYRWSAAAIPEYQITSGSANTSNLSPDTTTGGSSVQISLYNSPAGAGGCQAGQYMLCLMVEGDKTDTSGSTPNPYDIELIMHGEVIPYNPYSVSYSLTPSEYNPEELAYSLNTLSMLPCGSLNLVSGQTAGNPSTTAGKNVASVTANGVISGVKTISDLYNNPMVRTIAKSVIGSIIPGAGALL
jgi:hypothetical protein